MAVPSKIQPPLRPATGRRLERRTVCRLAPAREHRARARHARRGSSCWTRSARSWTARRQATELVDEQAIVESGRAAAQRLPGGLAAAAGAGPESRGGDGAVGAGISGSRCPKTPWQPAWRRGTAAEAQRLVDPQRRARVELAQQRLPLLQSLAQIPPNLRPDQIDRKVLAIWREDCWAIAPRPPRGARPTGVAVRPAGVAAPAASGGRQPATAGKSCRSSKIRASTATHFRPAWKAIVQWARDKVTKTRRVGNACWPSGSGPNFSRPATFAAAARNRRSSLRRITPCWPTGPAADVRSLEALGMGPAVARASLVPVDDPPGAYRVRWTWPPTRFSEECLLAICPQVPEADDDPLTLPALERIVDHAADVGKRRRQPAAGTASRLGRGLCGGVGQDRPGLRRLLQPSPRARTDSPRAAPLAALAVLPPAHWRTSQNHNSVAPHNPLPPQGAADS